MNARFLPSRLAGACVCSAGNALPAVSCTESLYLSPYRGGYAGWTNGGSTPNRWIRPRTAANNTHGMAISPVGTNKYQDGFSRLTLDGFAGVRDRIGGATFHIVESPILSGNPHTRALPVRCLTVAALIELPDSAGSVTDPAQSSVARLFPPRLRIWPHPCRRDANSRHSSRSATRYTT